jgi:CBS domain-containing protein
MIVRSAILTNSFSVSRTTSVYDLVAKILGTNQTTAAVLDESGELIGIVGAHDVLRKMVPAYLDRGGHLMDLIHDTYFEEKFSQFQGMTVEAIMVQQVDSLDPDDSLIKAAAMFVEKRRKSIPVLDKQGVYLGMVTRRSILSKVFNSIQKV